MEFHSWLLDKKVNGVNVSVDISIRGYWEVAQQILADNDLQRPRVSTRGKPYQLLQRDLIEGCVMPPIILALKQDHGGGAGESLLQKIETAGELDRNRPELMRLIEGAFKTRNFLILDGLQRSYTIGDCISQLKGDPAALDAFLSKSIRLEIYVGLNKTGILYRMLTLNTGQTPMSFRHQIEMLYHDYLDAGRLPPGLSVVREADAKRARGAGKYKFADVVDMFYAFSTGRPESIDRQGLVNKMGELEFLEEYDNSTSDLTSLLVVYNKFVRHVERASRDWEFDLQYLQSSFPDVSVERPFATNVPSLLERVQAMTAFGAEAKRLLRQGQIRSFEELDSVAARSGFSGEPGGALNEFVLMLDEIAKKASKIGTAQRELFQYSFRALLNPESETYLDLSACWKEGQRKFESLN